MAQNLQFSVSGSDYLETILYFNVRKYVQLLGLHSLKECEPHGLLGSPYVLT